MKRETAKRRGGRAAGAALLGFLLLAGCAGRPAPPPPQAPPTAAAAERPADPASPRRRPAPPKPRFKRLSPLDTQRVTLNFVGEGGGAILLALAKAAGLNLVLDPAFAASPEAARRLTAQYHEWPIREVLESVCTALDVGWRLDGGTVYISPLVERLIPLDFLGTVQSSRFSVGGDVLGGNTAGGGTDTDVLTPLTGSFELTGQNSAEVTDIYKGIEAALKDRLGDEGSYVLNRQTGTLMVRGRPSTVRSIEAYVSALRERYQRQVLIQAKILEIELDHQHELGIDWGQLTATLSKAALKAGGAVLDVATTPTDESVLYNLTLSQDYYNVSTVLRAMEDYGRIRTLSNPRLKVTNGQSAVISVGQSVAYLKSLETGTTTTSGGSSTIAPTAEIGSIFDGVLLGVTPIIEDDGRVSLHLVPIKSDLVSLDEREFAGGTRYTFPRVNLREASTVVRAASGDIVIIGGLIQERTDKEMSGLPVLDRLPLVGRVFRYQRRVLRRVEMVILLDVTVLDKAG
ncbi:pilus (MSHA type) biogenesis protein MshL [Dissulfurirhabdus thermomarina]|uniref:Pilus (MSHA type) biogenesis protein MshL n=1 Tax=Dissulfurirhabdus thermomarina TaxID=1765737 RepID=A0A6N9TM11_DISTH|nr:pilus (MSHA type) biogenesis protein MshL [Dissulfurirhabdus thermomarina]NDY42321.1 pilus (MSHA type) biogenesis protein MshL [Dissulfurirhabdus thermomarina]NMX22428.1 pilus (MSHA type) biogenesis protein MshL [Dissulfurirhabdus thermomarina]